MVLGGPVFKNYFDTMSWVAAVRSYGYRAAYCPIDINTDKETISDYVHAAKEAGIVIAEVGAWSNLISPDLEVRQQAIELCKQSLTLADRIGAKCCVNLAGSRGTAGFYDPHPDSFSKQTFEMIVEVTREIIDAVNPFRTYFTLEPMPWVYPDSPVSYLELINAIDRKRFAVHLDLTNMITSPRLFYNNTAFIRDCFKLLGPYIKSCHVKDIALRNTFSVHLQEVRPGLGALDYRTFLEECNKLPEDTPIMMEHLATEEEYAAAANYIRSQAAALNVSV